MEKVTLNHTRLVLERYTKQAVELYRYQISIGGKNASRTLIDSVRGELTENGSRYEVYLNLEHYWKYVEGGSKGVVASPAGAVYPAHFPPVSVLEHWIEVKGIVPQGDISTRSLAYLFARKIYLKGIEPFPALATTIEELNRIYEPQLEQALVEDVQGLVAEYVKPFNNG